jgi:hypothetical protein
MGCKNAGCGKRDASGACKARTCAATLTFHVVNFRTDVEFVLFSGGFKTPCLLKRSGVLRFANPASPLYGHLSSTDSKATSVSRATPGTHHSIRFHPLLSATAEQHPYLGVYCRR